MALFVIEVAAAACCGLVAGQAGAALLGSAAPRWWCEIGCALCFAPLPALGAGALLGPSAISRLCAAAAVVWWLVCLSVADLSVRRLPDALTLPGALGCVAAAAVLGRGGAALVGALCFAGAYFVIHLVSPRSMGAGDVKLALGLGALCAAVHPLAVLLVALLSSLISAFFAIVVLLGRRRAPPGTVAHGASMCLAAYAVLAAAWV
ncbi:MAG: prepilin peptidase [Segniliparus sp.]|uniref:prepilin peptidase n=1 Tax=Segniliparus sp. TaxID=2804064 RepID=UPI003F3E9480